jgi:hypothetical protein
MATFEASDNALTEQSPLAPVAPLSDFNQAPLKKQSGFKLKYGLALLALVIVGGGILAFSQSALRQSQENRSDAAIEPKIWLNFMEDPSSATANPVGLSSKVISRTDPSTVSLWLNNPNYQEITGAAIFVEYDPAVIRNIRMNVANQEGLNAAQQPVELVDQSYADSNTNNKVAVLKLAAHCESGGCYTIKSNGKQYVKLATLTVVPNETATTNTQIRFLFSANENRSVIYVKDKDQSLVQTGGFSTLSLNFSDSVDTTPTPTTETGGIPAKVEGLAAQVTPTTRTVALSWNVAANAVTYQVSRCKVISGVCSWQTVQRNIDTTTYSQSDVANGNYRYRVRGVTGAASGAWSSAVSVTMSGTGSGATPTPTEPATGGVPTKVTNLVVTPYCATTRNQLDWTQVTNATGYQIQFCKGGSCTDWKTLELNFKEFSYVHVNLTAGLYRYRVRAKNAAGNGAYSDIKQARIASDCGSATPTATTAADDPTPTTEFAPTEQPTITQEPGFLAGDFDENGSVSLAELRQVMDAYGQLGDVPENVNSDNEVNLLDVTIVLANFLR